MPFPPPGDLPDPGIELVIPSLVGSFFTTEPPGKLPRKRLVTGYYYFYCLTIESSGFQDCFINIFFFFFKKKVPDTSCYLSFTDTTGIFSVPH